MSSSNQVPQVLGKWKRRKKDCKIQKGWNTPQKQWLSDTRGQVHTWTQRECSNTQRDHTCPKYMGSLCWEEKADMNFHPYPRSYFQLTSSCKGKISFLQRNLIGFTHHTYGQVLYPVVDGQHKTNSTVYVEIFYLISLCVLFHLTRFLLVYYGFWFCVFIDTVCVLCVHVYMFLLFVHFITQLGIIIVS